MVRKVHAEGLRERQNMREANEEIETPPYELAALNENGTELYRTEYADSHAEAQQLASELNHAIKNGKVYEDNGEVVHKFVAVETNQN